MPPKTKPVDLEKEGRVIFGMLEEYFPCTGRRQPIAPTAQYYYPRVPLTVRNNNSTVEEEILDCNQAAMAYGGVVFVNFPPRKKVNNKRQVGQVFNFAKPS